MGTVQALQLWRLLSTLAETGRRIGEMLKLGWENVLLDVEPPHFDLPDTNLHVGSSTSR
jgi:integrase